MKNKFSIAMSLAVVLAILLTSLALADTIQSDGDVITANTQTTINLGTVTPGATLNPKVSFQLTCDGNKHVDNGQSVILSYSAVNSTVPAGGSLAATQSTISAIPTTWPDDGSTNCSGFSPIGDNGDSTVTISAPSTGGTYAFVVAYTAALSPAGVNDPSSITGSVPTVTYTLTVASDTTAPVITPNIAGTLGNNSWYVTDVTVSWSVVDNESSISSSSGCSSTLINSDTAGTTLTCSATSAGGTSSESVTIKRDATAPTLTFDPQDPAANANGWNNTNVSFAFMAADNLSGVASTNPASSPLVLTTEGLAVTGSVVVTDNAGNSATFISPAVKIDKTAPVLNVSGAASGASNVCSALPSRPLFGPTDALSGIDSQSDDWSTPSNPSGVGTYIYTANATDLAGNTASDTRTYTVTYGSAFSGVLQPINADGSSRFKLGSTIPVKFQLTCNGIYISNAVAKLNVAKGDNQADAGVDEAISTAASTTGNLFRYDSTTQQYIFNLSTKSGYTNPGSTTPLSFTTGTWTLKILLDDGKWYSVLVQLPK